MRRNWYYIFYEINRVWGSALIIFLIMESVKPRLVAAYVNFNLGFIFWLISAIMVLVLNKDK